MLTIKCDIAKKDPASITHYVQLHALAPNTHEYFHNTTNSVYAIMQEDIGDALTEAGYETDIKIEVLCEYFS